MINKGRRWIGIDGGGTKTECVIGDETGNILATSVGASSNIQSNPHQYVRSVLHHLIEEVIISSHSNHEQIESIFLCLSGCGRTEDKEIVRSLFQNTQYRSKISIENDAVAALASGTYGEPGIVLIAGTGSIAYGISSFSEEAIRAGGWGYLLGDEGSGYYIGQRAIQSVLRAFDGREDEVTKLSHLVLNHFNVKTPAKLISMLYGNENTRTLIAGLAELVIQAASEGDNRALEIIDSAIDELCILAKAIRDRLAVQDTPSIIIHGGLFSSRFFTNKFLKQMEKYSIHSKVIKPVIPPVVGAYILALKGKNILLNEVLKRNIHLSWNRIGLLGSD